MRIGIVVDANCDLPADFIEREKIVLLPHSARIGDVTTEDRRDAEVTLNFLQSDIAEQASEAETQPLGIDQIRKLFLEGLVTQYDFVFCMTVARTRSQIYDNATQASFAILNDYHATRSAAGIATPFSMRVIDTENVFAAQGVSAWECARMRDTGETPMRIRTRLDQVIRETRGYLVLPDLYYLRKRAAKKGERSVGAAAAFLGTALNLKPILYCNRGETKAVAKARGFEAGCNRLFQHAVEAVESGLLVPVVCVSYGGPLEELHVMPGYQALALACKGKGVELLATVMGLTAIINVGKGALSVGYAQEKAPQIH